MKSNSTLTYVLFGLLGIFVLAAGYYACEKNKREKALKAQEDAEQQEFLNKYDNTEDTTAYPGSTYTNTDSLAKIKTSPAKPNGTKNGNEKAAPTGKTTSTTTLTTPTKPKPVVAVKGAGSGRWAVRAGTFAYMEGARRCLEEVIKAGYPNAEISKTKEGKAAVVVFRSNNKEAAINVMDRLEEKGIDAALFDRQN